MLLYFKGGITAFKMIVIDKFWSKQNHKYKQVIHYNIDDFEQCTTWK
jgi:hypothetical protein